MTGPVVVANNEQDEPVDLARWSELARRALRHEGVDRGELNLLFVTPAVIAELNEQHLGSPGPTDVLSFPIDAPGDPSDSSNAPEREVLLGDVVICPEYAAAQAPAHRAPGRHDGTPDDEIALLVIHGVLHIVGHDHAEPAEATMMHARESELLAAYHRA